MYVIHPCKMVYLANPRTGSMTVRRFLMDPDNFKPGEVEIVSDGKSPGNHHLWGEHHGIDEKVLDLYEKRGYDLLSVLRNPWDHIVSWWSLSKDKHTFEEFVKDFDNIVFYTLPERFPTTVQILFHWSNMTIEFEGFSKYFKGKFGKDLGWMHNSHREGHYRDLFTPELQEIVAARYATEIEAYDYKF